MELSRNGMAVHDFLKGRALFVFNPETDYAHAIDCVNFTPPAKVLGLRRKLALVQEALARRGDAILLLDPIETIEAEEIAHVKSRGLEVVTLADLPHLFSSQECRVSQIVPWGWNHTLRHTLIKSNVPEHLLPTEEDITKIRSLAHRRTTIDFCREVSEIFNKTQRIIGDDKVLCSDLPDYIVSTNPREINDIEKVKSVLDSDSDLWLKAPWSSAGRGVLHTAGASKSALLEWTHGMIQRQGSIMVEDSLVTNQKSSNQNVRDLESGADLLGQESKSQNAPLDFATEWWCRDGIAEYLGLSVFGANGNGRYSGNRRLPQSELLNIIKAHAPGFGDEVIDIQRRVLTKLIAPYYDGPLGIDMLATADGRICICIEINLRMTMGHIALQP